MRRHTLTSIALLLSTAAGCAAAPVDAHDEAIGVADDALIPQKAILLQSDAGIYPEGTGRFGQHMAVADYDGDGYPDLATSAWTSNVEGKTQAGRVTVYWGGPYGLGNHGAEVIHADQAGGAIEADGKLGYALAAGDFDHDGKRDDLAITSLGSNSAGEVTILFGKTGGLGVPVRFDQSVVPGHSADGIDQFGEALVVGDFDGDGRDDLAIGTPNRSFRGVGHSGSVTVVFGPLDRPRNGILIEQSGLGAVNEKGDRFGEYLAVGDFDADGKDDLAIGAPGEDVLDVVDAGQVYIAFGDETRDLWAETQSFTQAVWMLKSPPDRERSETGDSFGLRLAAGDFDGDGYDDLAMSAPRENLRRRDGNIAADAGIVHIAVGGDQGLHASTLVSPQTELHADAPLDDAEGEAYSLAWFGLGLSAADLDGDGRSELLVGAPGVSATKLTVMQGTPEGPKLWAAPKQTYFAPEEQGPGQFAYRSVAADFDNDGTVELATAAPSYEADYEGPAGAIFIGSLEDTLPATTASNVTARAFVVVDRNTGDVLLSRGADQPQRMGDITKMMTLLVVLDALREDPSMWADWVAVSANAAYTGTSNWVNGTHFIEGDSMKMYDMLHALMLSSSDVAAIALAEHVAGTEDDFVARMNARADAMGLDTTVFVNAHGQDAAACNGPDDLASACRAVTTARETAVIAEALADDADVSPILERTSWTITSWKDANGQSRGDVEAANLNAMLAKAEGSFAYDGVVGTAGGYTTYGSWAGGSLALELDGYDPELPLWHADQGRDLIVIVLGSRGSSEPWNHYRSFYDATQILDVVGTL